MDSEHKSESKLLFLYMKINTLVSLSYWTVNLSTILVEQQPTFSYLQLKNNKKRYMRNAFFYVRVEQFSWS